MSGAGGYAGGIGNLYRDLPQGLGGSGAFPGQAMAQQNMQAPQGGVGGEYGQLGSYNTLAQDLSSGYTGRFNPITAGNPFAYQAAQQPYGRPGVSGYTGIGPFQNQGGGRIPSWMQTAQPFQQQPFRRSTGTFPGFGMGGQPMRYAQPAMPNYGYPGSGFFGGSGFGGYGFPSFPYTGGPGSFRSPGSMPFGGGSGMYSGGGGGATAMDMVRQPDGSYMNRQQMAAQQSPFGQMPNQIRPAQEVDQFRSYRSPFAGGGMATQYNPFRMMM